MSKFVLNKNVLVRTVLLRNDTYRLNEGITALNKGDISGCVATDLYVEKLNEIKSTIQLYSELARKDIDEYKANNRTITSYSPSSSVDVETFSQDGYEWARLYCVYDIKQDGLLYQTTLCFILRKDEDSHYKIYGWKAVNPNKQTSE